MLKRNLIICIRKAGTDDNPVVLPVVDDSIDISTKQVSTSINNVTFNNTKLTSQLFNEGVKESALKFTTYIKPYKDGNVVSIIDDLLYESLLCYDSTTNGYYTSINTFVLQKFDLFLIYTDTGTTFSLKDAVTVSATFNFSIDGIAKVIWDVAGAEYVQEDTLPNYVYPTNIDSYIINKWTKARLDFPLLNSGYDLASTKFSLSIQNSIQFPYTEKVNLKYNRISNTPTITKRSIDAKFSMYLKVISLPMLEDLISNLEQYNYLDDSASFYASFGNCNTETLKIDLNNTIIKYPKTKIDELSSLDLDINSDKVTFTYT